MSARCVECQNEAIERCEVSGVPLCASHLWYSDDGQRISEGVAKRLAERGQTVYSPQTYLGQLGRAAALPRLPEAPNVVHIERNGNDTIAVLAAIFGAISIATCFGIGIAVCLPPLPLLPLLLGAVGLAGAKHAADPEKARRNSWIGIAGGAGFVIIVLLLVVGSLALGTTSFINTFFTNPIRTP